MLLDARANPIPEPDAKGTYMHMACFHSHTGCVEVLLRRTEMENLRDENNELPYAVVGHAFPEEDRDNDVVEGIRQVRRYPSARLRGRRSGTSCSRSCREEA